MFNKDYRRWQAPSLNGFNNHYLFPILGVFFIISGLILKFLALGLPWFATIINWLAKWIIISGIVYWIPTFWHWINSTEDELSIKKSKYNLSSIKSYKFEQKLYEMRLFEKDAYNLNRIRLPQVKITNNGFKLSAIGKLRKQLLDDETISDFNSYLALNNTNCQIQSAYYSDGYVHYVVRHSISKDRLHF